MRAGKLWQCPIDGCNEKSGCTDLYTSLHVHIFNLTLAHEMNIYMGAELIYSTELVQRIILL